MRSILLAAALVVAPLGPVLAADAIEVVTGASGGTEIKIAKMKFQTPDVTVKSGSTVTWINTEPLPHNVHFKAGAGLEKDVEGPMLRSNETYSVKFNTPGTYNYVCTPHPFMKGKVTVE